MGSNPTPAASTHRGHRRFCVTTNGDRRRDGQQAEGLLLTQLGTLLYAGQQPADKVIPELFSEAENSELKQGLTLHETQTHDHLVNVRRVFELLGEEPKPKTDQVPKAPRKQHKRTVRQLDSPKLKDLAHADAVVKTEHLEIGAS